MVHRHQDTRLLSHVVKAEKEYANAIAALVAASSASIAALTAYAASCPPGASQVLLAVASGLGGAEEALRGYAQVVDRWRSELVRLREKEDEVKNVLRDREILVGKLVKATTKRNSSTLDVGTSGVFSSQHPYDNTHHQNGSMVKLSHAQNEVQACESHLALKEQELEKVRQEAIYGGLERKCRALVACGWSWSEKGKEALKALESSSNHMPEKETPDNAKSAPAIDHDSQLSSLTPSQSASQIALAVPGSDPGDSPLRRNSLQRDPRPVQFTLEIPPAHSIDDHDGIHAVIPSSRATPPADSSDEVNEHELQVHENNPFANRTPVLTHTDSLRVPGAGGGRLHSGRNSRPSTSGGNSGLEVPSGIDVGHRPSLISKKQKHSSDLGPRGYQSLSVRQAPGQLGESRQALHRKRSTSFTLLGSITGLFKGGKRPMSVERSHAGPTLPDAWNTRTNQNIERSRRGGGSSSEDDLPSTRTKRSSIFGDEPKRRLSKRMPISVSDVAGGFRNAPAPPFHRVDPEGSPRHSVSRGYTQQSRGSMLNPSDISSPMPLKGSLAPVPFPHSKSKGSRHPVEVESPSSTAARHSKRPDTMEISRRKDDIVRRNSASLPSPKLELVRAPPSITQVPLLVSPSPSALQLDSGGRGKHAAPRKAATLESHAPTVVEPVEGLPAASHYVPPISSTDSPRVLSPMPLKSALRNPYRTSSPTHPISSGSSTPSPGPRSHRDQHVEFKETQIQDPVPPIHINDHLSLSADYQGFRTRSPPVNSSILVPTPRRLSDIPASNRSSMATGEDGDSVYETPVEDFDENDEEDRAPTPPAKSPLQNNDTLRSSRPVSEVVLTVSTPTASGTQELPVAANSVSSASTQTPARRKSVRMIIHPTIAVSPPQTYDDVSTPTHNQSYPEPRRGSWANTDRDDEQTQSVPSPWTTRVDNTHNAWDDSSEEDEGYRKARLALGGGQSRTENGNGRDTSSRRRTRPAH